MKHDLKVGQKLFFVYSDKRRGPAGDVEVTKVGRKWAELSSHYRIDLVTLEADGAGYMSPGRCYLGREAYEAEVKLSRAWDDLRSKVSFQWGPPNGVTAGQIVDALALLNLDGGRKK